MIDRIGTKVKNHTQAVEKVFQILKNEKIDVIAHRVVHGGEKYSKPVKLDSKTIKEIAKLSPLAPLHNPVNLEGIKACKKFMPKVPQVAVFDTAFYSTLKPKTYLYAIPYELYKNNHIRRYGFHGTNHKYVTEKAIKILNKKNAKIISCHLGNGSSITASLNGKAVDTSMGFTPLEGVPMGTRCGSIDPAIVLKIQELRKLSPQKTKDFLNNECGLKALSRGFSDMRDIYHRSLKKEKNALLAMEIFSYQIAKYVGAYTASLNGLDALIFTGGIGENAFYIRKQVCEYLKYLPSKKVLVIKADEEYQIAKDSLTLFQ
jgi:acetate kinase